MGFLTQNKPLFIQKSNLKLVFLRQKIARCAIE